MTGAEQLSKAILESGNEWLGWPSDPIYILMHHL